MMKTTLFAIILTASVFAQDFIPFIEKLDPEWRKEIASAGITREIEYIDTPGFDVKEGNLPEYFKSVLYDENGKVQFVAQKLLTDDNAAEYEFKYNDKGYLQDIIMNWTDNYGNPSKISYNFAYEESRLSYVAQFDDLYGNGGATMQWVYQYSVDGRPESIVVRYFSSDEIGLFAEIAKYYFDRRGRIFIYESEDSKVTYSYNEEGTLAETLKEAHEIAVRTVYTYDGSGNLVSKTETGDAAETFAIFTVNAKGFPEKSSMLIKMAGVSDHSVNYLYFYE
ncbi:MAG: hypothetical protein HBSAPP04_15130 [Ignavibacteriaceae bacterium]|nr:MAG: hypothetical protein HBSAPP04_15130 [Ignavibacteriaceae bacterium]